MFERAWAGGGRGVHVGTGSCKPQTKGLARQPLSLPRADWSGRSHFPEPEGFLFLVLKAPTCSSPLVRDSGVLVPETQPVVTVSHSAESPKKSVKWTPDT